MAIINIINNIAAELKAKGYDPVYKGSPEFIYEVEIGKRIGHTVDCSNGFNDEIGLVVYYHDNVAEFGVDHPTDFGIAGVLRHVPTNTFENAVYNYEVYTSGTGEKCRRYKTSFKKGDKYYAAEIVSIVNKPWSAGCYTVYTFVGDEPEYVSLDNILHVDCFNEDVLKETVEYMYF